MSRSALQIHAWQDPSTDKWTAVASMGTGRWGLGLASLRYLYAAGGYDGNSTLASAERYARRDSAEQLFYI